MNAYVYILRCADGHYYVGSTRASLELRLAQHNDGTFNGYTKSRRPVELVYSEAFDRITDAISAERKLKGWSRAKKEALMRGDFDLLRELARRHCEDDKSIEGHIICGLNLIRTYENHGERSASARFPSPSLSIKAAGVPGRSVFAGPSWTLPMG